MGFSAWVYWFDGPFTTPTSLQARGGVYVVLDAQWVLDVGESHDVQWRLTNHDRTRCWQMNATGPLRFAATYTDGLQQAGRQQIEHYIRSVTLPPCGSR